MREVSPNILSPRKHALASLCVTLLNRVHLFLNIALLGVIIKPNAFQKSTDYLWSCSWGIFFRYKIEEYKYIVEFMFKEFYIFYKYYNNYNLVDYKNSF